MHHAKAAVWKIKLNEAKEIVKDPTHCALCFDYQKNLPLPVTNAGPEYYKRQLWIHNFDVYDFSVGIGTMFFYSEHYAKKGPNEVLSCLEYFLKTHVPDGVKHLHLFADNCFGQNKNRFMICFLKYLVDSGRFDSISFQFPIPGHSWMPCDKDFGKIEKLRLKTETVTSPSEYMETVKKSQMNPPFRVVYVEHPLTDDLENDGTPVCRVKDYKAVIGKFSNAINGITKIRALKFCKSRILYKSDEWRASRFR